MKIKRIIYGAPPSNTHAGGVKVIYQHSERLNELGIESAIWHPTNETFQCSWFTNNINKIKLSEMNPATDLIVLPEIWASTHLNMFKSSGFKVAIYVQNCYYTHVNLNTENKYAIRDAYDVADIVLSISDDTSKYLTKILGVQPEKIIIQRYSINQNLFTPKNKRNVITYMPRKMADHSARVVNALHALLPRDKWTIQEIHNMNEQQVAECLSESIIFLAFSEFEGLPVPPVEAALSGNYVIGYDGQGGKEYWKSPNFERIEQGNIQDFVDSVLKRVERIDRGEIEISEINSGIENLSQYFSKEQETNLISQFVDRAMTLR